ncbi:hypothetical protein P7C70_g9293, partial [Phenoliferia sp. Uapishka_3]
RYKGGSGGAYEKYWKEGTGAVVAILNPRVSRSKPVPGRPNTLTITPESVDSMMIIAQARDLASCEALRRDTGKPCGDWCDARVSKVCEYHTNLQLKRSSSRRAETYSANSSLLSSSTFDKKKFNRSLKPASSGGSSSHLAVSKGEPSYDPINKIGLLPRNPTVKMQGDSLTYVISSSVPSTTFPSGGGGGRPRGGKIFTATTNASSLLHLNTGGSRYIAGIQDGVSVTQYEMDKAQSRAQAVIRKEVERGLMEKDLGKTLGGQYLEMARVARKKKEREEEKEGEQEENNDGRKKWTKGNDMARLESTSEEVEGSGEGGMRRKKTFSTSAVRLIGYDPTKQGETGIEEDEAGRLKRLEVIDSLKSLARAAPSLAPPPGPRIRSVRTTPATSKTIKGSRAFYPKGADETDVHDDLPRLHLAAEKVVAALSASEDEDDDDLVVLPKEAAF